ncbi:MAG: TetR/AcrR family transcriptional regulator [Flavobacteriales bacterium]|nr:TetR/AcrR family transcriptional regulator [Flavobacteriales bacterium]
MELQVKIKMNEKLFLKDPESSPLGKKIIREGIALINKMGFEQFTFRKLAEKIGSTEAAIYKYFENKQRLLIYIVTWYWTLTEYSIILSTASITRADKKLATIIDHLCRPAETQIAGVDYDRLALYHIVISESNKIYLNKEVNSNNKNQMFKPYKDLCGRIAGILSEANPKFKYPRSLASTLLEMSHTQYFFMQHLPSLTDFGKEKSIDHLREYLKHIIFSSLHLKIPLK